MKYRKILSGVVLLLAAAMQAQVPERTDSAMLGADPWLHLYGTDEYDFSQYPMSEIPELRFEAADDNMIVGDLRIKMSGLRKWAIGPSVPRLDITTADGCYEITSKTEFVEGSIKFDGKGIYKDVTVDEMQIRGRGNSTWLMPKKPYRLKFGEKTKLGSVKKAKNLVLLANYLDKSLMRNFVAMKFAQLIGADFPNHVIPVDVYLNGFYKGSYMLTEKIGINNGSVDLSKEDEPNSILFEIDSNEAEYDEYPFKSDIYGLPVRFKDPDALEDYAELKDWIEYWQNDFNEMEAAVYHRADDVWTYIDLDSFVRYIMVFNLCSNHEIRHPKSVYCWKTKGQPYHFGPVWDFDWAFNFGQTDNRLPLFYAGSRIGNYFFLPLVQTDAFIKRYGEIWSDFYQNHLGEFFAAFDAYADLLESSAANDAVGLLPNSYYHSYLPTPDALRAWLEDHIEWINDPTTNHGLWND